MEVYKEKSLQLDEKERELCRKTNQLVEDLAATCEDTPFHKALIKILKNMKGNIKKLPYRTIYSYGSKQSFSIVTMSTTRNNSKTCGDNVSILTDTVHSLQVSQEFNFKRLDNLVEKVHIS